MSSVIYISPTGTPNAKIIEKMTEIQILTLGMQHVNIIVRITIPKEIASIIP